MQFLSKEVASAFGQEDVRLHCLSKIRFQILTGDQLNTKAVVATKYKESKRQKNPKFTQMLICGDGNFQGIN